MTSTPVRDSGAVLANLAAAQAGRNAGSGVIGTGGFQKVWDNQMNKGAQGSPASDSFAKAPEKADLNTSAREGESVKAQGGQSVQNEENSVQNEETAENSGETKEISNVSENAENRPEELTEEELEQAMEVLGSAALKLMQQIADAFGVTMEELQAAMDALGMKQTDVLNADALGGLLLKLGGAEDMYALITDEALYGNYRMLMDQLNGVLEESAAELAVEPDRLESLLEKISVSGTGAEEITVSTDMGETAGTESAAADTKQTGISAGMAEDVTQAGQGVSDEQARTDGRTEEHSDQAEGEGKQSSEKFDGEAHNHLFVQDMREGQFQPEIGQAQSVLRSSGWTADTKGIMGQIMDYMKLQLSADTTSLEMQLHPASLGTLQVRIDSGAGVLTAHFITQNEAVKTALESQMVQLQEQFEEQGIKVEAIEVTVQTHEFEQNLEQGRGRNQQEPEKRNRTRRINLNDSLVMEAMEEEDALAAEMMAASGSTVDYTA